MATNELQLPPDVRETIEELEQELREGDYFSFCHCSWFSLAVRNQKHKITMLEEVRMRLFALS